MTETRKAGRPLGAKNKHPQVLRIDIKLTDTKGTKPMQQMTISELGKHIETSHNALVKLEGCISALTSVAEIQDSLPDIQRVLDSLKSTKQNHLDEYKKRVDFKKPYEKVCFDVAIKFASNPQNIALMLERGKQDVLDRRIKFQQAGMSEADSVAFVPDFDATERLAEIEKRRVIADSWKRFAATGLEADLPENAAEMLEAFGSYQEYVPSGVFGRPISVMEG
ncbi:hypothetical protein [Thiothrix subterranea]|uniref:Uncharacterized protein n=1 Tax=Thiothrix subterranea TaxID=2735563 RepID=A0AA51MPQ7_9GAMM|nr:hypothetical protein [Thiothrix subterranea]MDQ5770980.1 hypothetical protein [Thiothrix subterranea]WML85981.1 hypothetical protein RCG00_16975 [Thiothrix subterranea]